jgi:predicted O-methyltransferase YrrM
MNFIDDKVQAYAEKYTSAEDALLHEVGQFTLQNHPKSHMLSGHLQGMLLKMISCLVQPKRILEIGTFTGYSALCLAKGLSADGQLHTIEVREEDAANAQNFFRRSFYKERIILHIGNALQIIDELDETWDLVFIDADKENYSNYFDRVFSRVRPGGLILADNVLFHGQVLEAEVKGKNAKAIQAFNDLVLSRTDVEKLMLPVRDGIYLIRKLH